MKRFKLGVIGAARVSIAASLGALCLLFFQIFLHCDNAEVAGLTVSYQGWVENLKHPFNVFFFKYNCAPGPVACTHTCPRAPPPPGLLKYPTSTRLCSHSATWDAPAQWSIGTPFAATTEWPMHHPAWLAVRPPPAPARRWLDNSVHSLVVIRKIWKSMLTSGCIGRVLMSPYQNCIFRQIRKNQTVRKATRESDVITHLPVLWSVRCFITVPALARWWRQAWTCPQCWVSAPGRMTAIASLKSTWLCLCWAPSSLPAGAPQATWCCSGQWWYDTACTHLNQLIGILFLNVCADLPGPFSQTWRPWLWGCKHWSWELWVSSEKTPVL